MEFLQKGIKFIELFALLCSIAGYIIMPVKTRRNMLIIMTVIVFTDWMAFFKIHLALHIKTNQWFNLFVPVQLCLWSLFILSRYVNAAWKKYGRLVLLGYLALSVLIFIYLSSGNKIWGLGSFFTPGYALGVILLSVFCFRYLYEFANSDQLLQKWYHTLLLLVFSLVLFYLGTLPFHAMRTYLYTNFINIFNTYFYLFLILNYSLYLTISWVALCTKEK